MDREALIGRLVTKGAASHQDCVKVSATRFVPDTQWAGLKRHEQAFLAAYATGLAAHKAVLVGRSAARVHDMWVLPARDEMVELAQRGGAPPSTSQWPESVTYRRMAVPDADLDTFRGVRLTTRARTVADVARLHGARQGAVAIDGLLYGLATYQKDDRRAEIDAVVRRLAGKRGVAQAREALRLATGRAESPFETFFRVILAENGIEVQEQMWIGGFRVDLLWGNLIIEIDGRAKYEDVPHAALMQQLERENWLKEMGYEVIRLFPRDILRDEMGCVTRVLEAKARADARGPVRVKASKVRMSSAW